MASETIVKKLSSQRSTIYNMMGITMLLPLLIVKGPDDTPDLPRDAWACILVAT